MKTMQSFLMFFYILDQCYAHCEEDMLGAFLGAISPELWGDGLPADQAVIGTWEKVSDPKTVNEQNVVKKSYDFLTYYENRFGLMFPQTKQCLITLDHQALVKNAVERTKGMYQKHNYRN